MKSTAAILATAMFVGDCTVASPSPAGVAAVSVTVHFVYINISVISVENALCLKTERLITTTSA